MIVMQFTTRARRLGVVAVHIVAAAAVYVGSFAMRFIDGEMPPEYLDVCLLTLPVLVGFKMAAFLLFGLHKGVWAHAGTDDLMRIVKANTFATAGLIAYVVLTRGTPGFPRSVFVIDWLGGILVFGGMRFLLRLLRESKAYGGRRRSGARTLIAGAGDTGEMALRELRTHGRLSHYIVGFIDDDPRTQKMSIHGVSVLGTLSDAPKLVGELNIEEILVAMPRASKKSIRELIDSCSHESVHFRILPAVKDLMTGRDKLRIVRDVRHEDLLEREPVKTDLAKVHDFVRGRSVLVTGAGGSIGSEIARQVAVLGPRSLVLFDMAESALFEIDMELDAHGIECIAAIGDLRNADMIDRLFAQHRPDVVYHAAAYKHVPLMENHPEEAVLNNIGGTRILADAATRHGTSHFVMISSDKAVRPTNVMGITKRICELVVSSANGAGTCFSSVRFGNVLGSNGSVVPIFRRQIESGGPVTVTHPDITRYFMTTDEAVALVLQCGVLARGGEVFVLDMGTPVKIVDLARNMITLSGYRVGEDMDIEITGLRPGERLHEELITYGETLEPSEHLGIGRLRKNGDVTDHRVLRAAVGRLEDMARRRDAARVKDILTRMIELDEMTWAGSDAPRDEERLAKIDAEWKALADSS